MKKLLIILVSLANIANAQQWLGSSTSTGAIYHNGAVGIGINSSPGLTNGLIVGGSQSIFGSSTLQGSYGAGSTILELNHGTAGNVTMLSLNSGSGNGRSVFQFGLSSFGANIYSTKGSTGTSYPICFYTTGSSGMLERMRIANDGSVGVGTSSPISEFQVGGGVNKISMGSCNTSSPRWFYNYIGFNVGKDISNNWILNNDGGNNGGALIAGSPAGNLSFIAFSSTGGSNQTKSSSDVNSNIKMEIKADGKVGIGNTNWNGTYKLYVGGGIIAEKIKVATQSNWADFVFENDYKLPTLHEVEKFIKTHKHLPEIPTAEEVSNNGVDLAEMQVKLLQKIEELTLYVIDQQKEIDALKQSINNKQ